MNRDWTWQDRVNDAKCTLYGGQLSKMDREELESEYCDRIGDETNELCGFTDEKIRMILIDNYQTKLEV